MKLKKEITKKDLDFAKTFIETSLKKDCGTNSEKSVIKKQKYTKGNNCIFTFTNSEFNWAIRGFHDATDNDNDVVIEIKTRMKLQNVRRNEYDLYQLFGYLISMNKTRGKIVQYFNDIVYDSYIQ
jgi:CRISPR/Cas system-associated exonuclease Cas4 (RecB family)